MSTEPSYITHSAIKLLYMDRRFKGMLTRREMLKHLARAGAATVIAPMFCKGRYRIFANSQTEYSARAIKLVQESLVIDALNQFKLWQFPTGQKALRRWMYTPGSFTEADAQRYKDSGINVFCLGAFDGDYEGIIDKFGVWNSFIAQYEQWFMRIDSVEDLERVKKSGKVGILISSQNSRHFDSLNDVDEFYGLGQRISQLTYNSRNLIGNGAFERRDEGISEFGAKIIERMNRVGMVVDVGHAGDKTTLDAFELSKKPVIISHSSCRSLIPNHPRATTDEAIKKMAVTGGVIGILLVRFLIGNKEPVTIESLLDHFDYVKNLVGVEHLGIGSDYDLDGYDAAPKEERERMTAAADPRYGSKGVAAIDGIKSHPKRVYDITEGLIRRKYNDDEIKLILGGNFKRVFSQCWV